MRIPEKGMAKSDVLAALVKARDGDANWRDGRTFSLVYFASDEVLSLLHDAFDLFFSENALNPLAFPSLRRFETEVVGMALDMLGAPDGAGSMTSGGTESILMAVKTARDWARKERNVTRPQMIVPITIHPAFEKAAHYFDVEAIHAPVDATFRVDVSEVRKRLTDQTILIVGSAPAYPHGVVDPIPELAALAKERGILCHVDACVGGFMLPWIRKLGHPVPDFDFRVPGVTSMSADIHKYGYAAKGASTVLYRDRALRKHQFLVYADWPGGIFGSPTATGTRPGGPIAAAWAVMHYLGESGYLALTERSMKTARTIIDGVRSIPGLRMLGEPVGTIFAFAGDDVDVYALADAMDARGWKMDRQHLPPSLHMMITPAHEPHAEKLVSDLRECAAPLRGKGPATEGSAVMYGMLGSLPDRGQVKDLILEFMDGLDAS